MSVNHLDSYVTELSRLYNTQSLDTLIQFDSVIEQAVGK